MHNPRPYRSLRLQITAGLLLPLVVVVALLSYLQYVARRQSMLSNLSISAANTGQIIQGSLRQAMLNNDFSLVQLIMEDVSKQAGVTDVFLLDKRGNILVSSGDLQIGQTLDIKDPTCQACHSSLAASRNASVIVSLGPGHRVFRNINTIENTAECRQCHGPEDMTMGVLISDFDMRAVDAVLATDQREALLWSLGASLLIVVLVNVMLSRLVVSRLQHLVQAMTRIGRGEWDTRVAAGTHDEIGLLADSFNSMAAGLKDRDRLKQDLQTQAVRLRAQTEQLSTLNTLAATVGQSLDLQLVLRGALQKVLELLKLQAGWAMLWGRTQGAPELIVGQGLPAGSRLAEMQALEEICPCAEASQTGRARVFAHGCEPACAAVGSLGGEALACRACVPLRSKDRILGVMSLVGGPEGSPCEAHKDMEDLLTAIGRQIGVAVENASLYEELRHEEDVRRQLLERVISVQEEERKRIARELHDETGQPLTYLIMTLRVIEESRSLTEVHARLGEMRETVMQVLQQVHDLALELRPAVLDDLGLLPALRHYFRTYQDRFRLPVDFQVVGLDGCRLPSDVETALYRITQEALTNVARHAHAETVSILLEHRGHSVVLVVEDDGCGFDVSQVGMGRGQESNLGLYSMRERATLLGGHWTVESTPDAGTSVFVEIPLTREGNDGETHSNTGRG